MKKDTAVREDYPIYAPIIRYFGMRRISRMKFERSATEEKTGNIFVFPIPCRETKGISPEVNMEMVTRPKVTCNDAIRLVQFEMNSGIDEEGAATIITIGHIWHL